MQELANTVTAFTVLAFIIAIITAFSVFALWKSNPLIFLILSPLAFMGGLRVYDLRGDDFFLTFSLVLIIYSYAALVSAIYFMFNKSKQSVDLD